MSELGDHGLGSTPGGPQAEDPPSSALGKIGGNGVGLSRRRRPERPLVIVASQGRGDPIYMAALLNLSVLIGWLCSHGERL